MSVPPPPLLPSDTRLPNTYIYCFSASYGAHGFVVAGGGGSLLNWDIHGFGLTYMGIDGESFTLSSQQYTTVLIFLFPSLCIKEAAWAVCVSLIAFILFLFSYYI